MLQHLPVMNVAGPLAAMHLNRRETVGSKALSFAGILQLAASSAMVHANAVLQAQIVTAVVIIALFAVARLVAGRLDRSRRVAFKVMTLLWLYALGQAAFGLLLTHGFPRLVAQP